MKSEYNKGSSKASIMLGGMPDEPHTIVWISTHPQSRNKGNAKKLLKAILADADRNIRLHLNPERGIERERLRKLFEGEGFVTDKKNPDYMTWTKS